jgi:hypothetical protein
MRSTLQVSERKRQVFIRLNQQERKEVRQMSALLVEDETINRSVAWLSWEVTRRDLGTITAHPPVEEERTS